MDSFFDKLKGKEDENKKNMKKKEYVNFITFFDFMYFQAYEYFLHSYEMCSVQYFEKIHILQSLQFTEFMFQFF